MNVPGSPRSRPSDRGVPAWFPRMAWLLPGSALDRGAGFTLAEVLVAATLFTVVLSSAILVYNLSYRSRGVTASARGLQTAMMVEERISNDLRRLVRVAPSPFQSSTQGPSLSFYACDLEAPPGKEVPVRAVRYSLENPPALLQREWSGRTQSVGLSPLTSIEFHPFLAPTGPVVRVSMEVGRGPDEPEGSPVVHSFMAGVAAPRRGEFLEIRILSPFMNPDHAPGDPGPPAPASAGSPVEPDLESPE